MLRDDAEDRDDLPHNWRRICRRVLRRCEGRCEWTMPDVNVRCDREAAVIVHVGAPDDHSVRNLRGFCARHYARKRAEDRLRARYVAIKVRPPRPDGGKS